MERFDIVAERNGVTASPEAAPPSNGVGDDDSISVAVPSPPPSSSPVKHDPDSDEASEPTRGAPPIKKRKPNVDADALFAAKLQAEENLRARPTRGGGPRRTAPSKKRSKAKTAKRIKAEDDSDIESSSDTKKEVNRTGGFHVSLIPYPYPQT